MAPKRKAQEAAPAARAAKAAKPTINHAPTQRLNVYTFGEGGQGELGLGTAKQAVDVKRPRLNPYLPANRVGTVQVEAGGMHSVVLTHDNKILTWGVNDQGALGRNTQWEGGLRDMDAASDDSDSDDDDNGLNPHESVPGEVDWAQSKLPEGMSHLPTHGKHNHADVLIAGTRFTQVTAGDSCSFALTADGSVYGWGTFRSNEGILGFTPEIEIATRPVLIKGLKNITMIKAGSNHCLALDTRGAVFSWGAGQQNQLGRRVIERTKGVGLTPREFGLPKGPKNGIISIESGPYHSFAISKNGTVYGWGLNNMGETGIMENAGKDDATIMNPRVIEALRGKTVVSIDGGSHHSIAATKDGDCLVWGRMDGSQMGISEGDFAKLPANATIKDGKGKSRILAIPQKVKAIKGHVTCVAASSDHNIVVTKEGKAWSWGFSANYQTGQGTTDDIEEAMMIDNTATRDKQINYAACGGQFGILTAVAAEEMLPNGI